MNWFKLHPKIQNALALALGLDSAAILAWVNGTTTWKESLAAIVTIDLPVLAGYLTPSKTTPEV
jgi:hypothetical protein